MATLYDTAFSESLNIGLNSTLKGIYNTSNILLNFPSHYINVGTMGYFGARCYYFNEKYYLAWAKERGSPNNLDAMVCVYDGKFTSSTQVISGADGDTDAHSLPSVIVDNDGYIYLVRCTGDAAYEVKIYKSDSPNDISSFTLFQTFTALVDGVVLDGHQYNGFIKCNNDLYLIMRSTFGNHRIHKKGLSDAVFNNGHNFVTIGTGKTYRIILRNNNENKIGLAVMLRNQVGAYTHNLFGYIESSDGVNWTNISGTYSRDTVTDGAVPQADLISDCIINYTANVNEDHWFCMDGIMVSGVPYLLVEEGYASSPILITKIDYSNIVVRYWNGSAWERKIIPSEISRTPYTRLYSERQLYHIAHDGDKFILFVLSADFKTVSKYTTIDFETYELEVNILDSEVYTYGLLGSCQNRSDLSWFQYNKTGVSNFITHKY